MNESSIQSDKDNGGDGALHGNRARRRPWWRGLLSALAWTSVVAYFAAAALFLGLRYWLLPDIAKYAGAVEQALSRTIGERVTIGGIQAGWHGLRPELELTDFRIHDRDGRMVLSLPGVDATVSWASFVYASIHFHSLVFDQPDLEIRRNSAGRVFIAGMELKGNQSGPDFSGWLLSQREIVVRNASLSWEDEHRAAPRLKFSGVTLALHNSGDLHRFALRAHTDSAFASALDVRGELHGGSFEKIQDWTGRLYAELDYADLAAWQRWFDYPLELHSGRGGVRLWLGFSGKRLTEATADVALAKVSARLGRELPLLELDYLEGRLGGKQLVDGVAAGFEVFGKGLSLKTGMGVALPAADFAVRWDPGSASRPPSGELQANALELQPLAHLGEFLPFPQAVRRQLGQIEPRGSIFDLKLSWSGDPDRPEQYSVRGRFANLGARALHGLPAFSGLAGQLDGNEKGGNLFLGAKNATIELPGILPDEQVNFDALTAQLSWSRGKDGIALKFSNVALANRDIAGTLFGTFATKSDGPGLIDLSGNFSRLDGTRTYRYIPRLPESVRSYLKSGVQAGHAFDIRLRLKGDLRHFPFDDPKQGSFQVVGKVSGVDFNYAEGWPGLTGVSGELVFEGRQMRILAPKGAVLGARLVNAKATIADLFNHNELLNVEGQAEGATAEFLRFVDSSPVTRFIDGYTSGMRATGNARLQLKLELPIRRLPQTKVAGSLQLTGNQIVTDPDIPAFSQVTGRLDFTESGINGRNLASQFLGGPTVISVATLADGTVTVGAQGTATVAAARRLVDLPVLDYASGSAVWRASVSIKRRAFELLVESSLQGVTLKLPSPLGKTAGEALPMRIARTNSMQSESLRRFQVDRLPPRGDAIMLSIGRTLNGVIVRARDGERMVVERGALGLNAQAPMLERPGIVVAGSLPYLDFDHWRALFGSGEGAGSATPATPLTALILQLGALDFAGRRVNELTLRATRSAGLWTANVSARELAGDITWRPEGQGRIAARLRHLIIPDPAPDAPKDDAQFPAQAQVQSKELPALDIVADTFVAGSTKFGRLELVAINQTRDWRIERLVLSNPESTLTADGYWQSWAARPSTNMNVKLEVSDAGKYLERLGFPRTMRGGSAHLEGKVGWSGSPLAIDYPTLTGNVSLKVDKGQFLKVDPGAAKLLGILSLQSLLTFDLRDLFSEGFAFDTISSSAQVAKGVLTTGDFDMRGASARVGITGDIDLAHETQKLRLRVVPALGDSAATAATLLLNVNPLTALGALIAQRILKDPLGQIFSFEYSVSGGWSEPRVERVQSEPRDSAVQ